MTQTCPVCKCYFIAQKGKDDGYCSDDCWIKDNCHEPAPTAVFETLVLD